MCLINLRDEKPKEIEVGFKVYYKTEGGNYRGFIYDSEHKMGETYKIRRKSSEWFEEYTQGYHFYFRKSDAEKVARYYRGVVVRVLIGEITATGDQESFEMNFKGAGDMRSRQAGCARKITLLREEKDFGDEKYDKYYPPNGTWCV